MADAFCRDEFLRIDDVGGRDLRVTLLSLEPGSRIWLSIDGDEIEFERLPEDDGLLPERSYRPVGSTAHLWLSRAKGAGAGYIEEIEVVERPQDRGTAGRGFYRREEGFDRLPRSNENG